MFIYVYFLLYQKSVMTLWKKITNTSLRLRGGGCKVGVGGVGRREALHDPCLYMFTIPLHTPFFTKFFLEKKRLSSFFPYSNCAGRRGVSHANRVLMLLCLFSQRLSGGVVLQ